MNSRYLTFICFLLNMFFGFGAAMNGSILMSVVCFIFAAICLNNLG